MQLRGKLVTSRLLREEEKEEETNYVAIPLRRTLFELPPRSQQPQHLIEASPKPGGV